jgi:Arc/MetJ-type ribon-helix-helix transcriptional regulator
VKLSVSLPDEDVEMIDRYRAEHGDPSRSAVVQRALALLRAIELADHYAVAWSAWDREDADDWDVTVADGLQEEP